MENYERDLWKESRDKSATYVGSWWIRLVSWILKVLFPTKFFPVQSMRFGTSQSVLCVDLNKYRPDVNVEMLIDQGIRCFMLRVIGPTRWVYGNWGYEVDATFVPYYERIRAYAKEKNIVVWIVGYGVHNPWSNEPSNYTGLDPQVRLLKEATRNHLCDMYCWDDEVAECWKDGKNTVMTGTNLVKSISICMEQTFYEMELWQIGLHKMPIHYSANWYMKKYAQAQYQVWLDSNNRDVNTRRFLTWRAWLPTTFTEVFQLITDLFAKVITPTGIQENNYLRMGSELAADLWQCTFTAKGPWCGPLSQAGVDASISYGPSAGLTEFIYNANLPITQTEPDPEDPGEEPDPEPIGDYVTKLEFNNFVTDLVTMLQKYIS